MAKTIYSVESVTMGHPDKLCDLISDSVLDACLAIDKNARVACEVMATKGKLIVAGEITVTKMPDVKNIVEEAMRFVGYDPSTVEIEVLVHEQSPDIAQGVDNPALADAYELGAGDQGVLYGYASAETAERLPLPCVLAHRITRLLTDARKSGRVKGLRPDGKAQVSVVYENDRPIRVDAVVVSTQHDEEKSMTELERDVREVVLKEAFADFPMDENTRVFINPSGRFVLGGYEADTGLTGRKLMVDTYGGFISHGGGAFSGKDATKVDRSGSYLARYIAKNIVDAGLAKRCLVSLCYAIGVARPVEITVDTYGTSAYDDEALKKAVLEVFDCRPAAIRDYFDLCRPIYTQTTNFGHFGKPELPWEQSDAAEKLKKAVEAAK
ncbi:MAG: methionine adenosyltransferase [Clostridiaceae bacterium]|nr:methionine adenosyltransferase [Eubacteriales bacterium]